MVENSQKVILDADGRPLPADPQDMDSKHLGAAGRTARAFIDSPITPLLLLATLALGIIGLLFTPRQEDPQISVPMIDIFVQYPGASADQVASLVTEPLERIMMGIPGVKHVYSATERGQAIVTVRFKVNEPQGPSVVKVHDKLQSNLDKIPPGVSMPLVKPMSADDVPVVTLTLWSEDVDDASLRTLGLDVLQRLQEVRNTGKGFVVGGRSEQIRVEIIPERLAGYRISLDQVANAIRTANSEQQAGSVESGGGAFTVYTGSFLRTAEEVSRLVVGTYNGAPVYVRDVARVFHGPEDARKIVTMYSGPDHEGVTEETDGAPAVTVALAKKEGSNGVTVAEAILEKVDQLRGSLIPDNIHVTVTRDYGKTANDKVNELLKALFEAAVAVSILCLIGLGTRAAFVVITVIPVVILATIFSALVLHYTIDRVSLFALIFAIGILVDDATVVVENIFRRWMQAGSTRLTVAIDAVREVGNPTILATLTIIAALLPMGFVRGLMGPYMRPIPVLGSCAMALSLIAAFIFTPWFANVVRPASTKAFEKAEARQKRSDELVGKFYHPIIWPLIKHRPLGILFLVTMIVATASTCALFYFKNVPVKMMPFDNKPEFNVIINMPEGTSLPVTANVASTLADLIRKDKGVTAVQSYVGTASPFSFNGLVRHYYLRQRPWEADIQVMLVDKEERELSSHEIAAVYRHKLTPVAREMGARIQIVELPPGPPVLQSIVAEIHGPDQTTRRQFASDMLEMFEKAPNIVDVDTYMDEPHTYWRFEVDTQKAIRRGISVETINRNVAMAMGGYKLGDVKRAAPLEPTYIVIQAPLAIRSQLASLSNLPIMTSTGQAVPLGELGRFVQVPEDHYIFHKDLRAIEYVTGEGEGRLGAPIYGMFQVEDQLENYTAPDGVKVSGMPWGLIGPPDTDAVSGFEWAGEWTVTYEVFRDMGMAYAAAMLLIYGLIVVQFRNYALAGLTMGPIPLTLLGIIPGHWLMGKEFTATSMIGMIALAGIIVRVSILIVQFVIEEVERGKDVIEAAVAAGRTRLRPIFITSFTNMAGAYMILDDPIFNGLAISLFFGTLSGTIFTLLIIPLGCISARKHILVAAGKGHELVSEAPAGGAAAPEPAPAMASSTSPEPKMPLLLLIWSKVITVITMAFYVVRAVFILLREAVLKLLSLFGGRRGPSPSTPPPAAPPSGGGGSGGPAPIAGGGGGAPVTAAADGSEASTATATGAGAEVAESQPEAQPATRAEPVAMEPAGKKEKPAKAGQATSRKPEAVPASGADEASEAGAAQKPGPSAADTAHEAERETAAGNGNGQASRKRRGIRLMEDFDTE